MFKSVPVSIEVIKRSGKVELLQPEKIEAAVARLGGGYSMAQEVAQTVLRDLPPRLTTRELYARVSAELRQRDPRLSLKFNLKRAILNLGPSGFPFEQYIAKILQHFGYKTETNLILKGRCVKHEIDIRAERGSEKYLIECKFHHTWETKSDVQVALSTYARVLDLNEAQDKKAIPWLITNTRLSLDAVEYGECRELRLTAWHYPLGGESLEALIEKSGHYPITILLPDQPQTFQSFLEAQIVSVVDLFGLTVTDLTEQHHLPRLTGETILKLARLLVPDIEKHQIEK